MKPYKVNVFLVAVSSLLIIQGCSPGSGNSQKIQINPSLHTLSKEEYKNNFIGSSKREIELPQNYSQKNYKRLILSANFFANKDYKSYESIPMETLSSMLETEISKLKRFTLVSRHLGQKSKWAEKKFQDSGVTDMNNVMRLGNGLNAEYSITGAISSMKEEYDRGSKNEVVYIVRVDYQITDLETDEIIEADMAEGRSIRTIMRLPSGKIIGGFTKNDESEAVKQAAINSLKIIANKLGNKLPIGCQVVGMVSDKIACDKGYDEGLMGKQMMVVYADYMGIDLPLAVFEAQPGANKTSGKIVAWSHDNDANSIIEKIKKDHNFARENDIYAVSLGMPIPPEWDNNYAN